MDNSSGSDLKPPSATLTIAATFTAQTLEQALAFWIDELGMTARVAFAPYNQVFQQLLDRSSLLSTNRHGVNVLLIRLEDWQTADGASEFLAAVRAAAARLPVPFLVVFCPASPEQAADADRVQALKGMEEGLIAALAEIPAVEVVSSADLMDAYSANVFYDPQGDKNAHAPYTPLFSTALATVIARWYFGLTQTTRKVIVVDCDDTLWTGLCGEDGPHGIAIDAGRRAVQDYLVGLHEKGVLVCLCSRNNEADVLAVFDSRSDEMPLKRDHIVSSRFNWKPKSENIRALATDLELSLDTFVFLDNDPVECAEVLANCSEVLTLQPPSNAEAAARFLRNLWLFDGRKSTEEARARTTLYQQNLHRTRMRDEAPSLADFLARLDLKVHFTDLTPGRTARAAELTQRTNQFNLTAIRRSEAEIEAVRQRGANSIVVQVKDRFGDYGVVGLMLFDETQGALAVDTFLLSCRALGRGVEYRMLKKLGQTALERNVGRVDLPFAWSGRNQPALDFLKHVAEPFQEPHGSGIVFRVPADVAAAARYEPDSVVERAPKGTPIVPMLAAAARANARADAALLTSIARDMGSLDQVHALVAARTRSRPHLTNEFIAPRTPAEKSVAVILAQVLGIDRVGVEDSFFDLGGHSLLAVQVLSRIKEEFHVELSTRLLYHSSFTAADLAARVQTLQLERANPVQIATLLERLNALSDDEVVALLARETEATGQPNK